MQKYLSNSAKNTQQIAEEIAKHHNQNRIFALNGELGAGKTTFVQGFAKGLGIKDKIISPTFVLIRHHIIPNTTSMFYHIDLYRLDSIKDLQQIGLEELLSNSDNIVLIEWADKIINILPKNILKISIDKLEDNKRLINVE